jgi:hypothetical protein
VNACLGDKSPQAGYWFKKHAKGGKILALIEPFGAVYGAYDGALL